ncbi:MAG: putative methyltransferase YrrT [Bacteroidetes bacterium ADurb.Bin141]|nr:MAG: putative methyltransferase YrrT [Bacteroidetes bacterium ADurb.Bin141]
MERMDKVKNHFEEEAAQYDGIIKNLIPYYDKMVEALVNTLPFDPSKEIQVIDLGCGTGTISRAVRDVYPNAKLTCVDLSEKMLKVAAGKLSDVSDAMFINKNFYDFSFDKKYDVVVSSLALHHLETKKDKLEFYRKIYSCLNVGGVFINADVVLASTEALQECYMTQWKNFMLRNVPKDEVDNKWIPTYYEEDRPVSMMEHIEMLKDSGFKIMDVVWKYYNFAVYMAIK